jgi:hypothetical protein
MVAEVGGNMACMEDQVVFCVCEKELCLSGTVAGFFERELFPPSLSLSLSLKPLRLTFSISLFSVNVLMLYKLKNQYFRKEPINTNQIACMERIIVCNLLDIYILILNTWNWLRSSQKLKILHVMFWSEIF